MMCQKLLPYLWIIITANSCFFIHLHEKMFFSTAYDLKNNGGKKSYKNKNVWYFRKKCFWDNILSFGVKNVVTYRNKRTWLWIALLPKIPIMFKQKRDSIKFNGISCMFALIKAQKENVIAITEIENVHRRMLRNWEKWNRTTFFSEEVKEWK